MSKKASLCLIAVSVVFLSGCLFKKKSETSATPALLSASIDATPLASPSPLAFSTVDSGSTSTKTVTITNSGGSTATSLDGTGLATPFTFAGGTFPGTGGTCTTQLASSATCTLALSFAPTVSAYQEASYSDTLSLAYNDGSANQTLALLVSGDGDNCSTETAESTLVNSSGSASLAWESSTGLLGQSFTPASAIDLSTVTLKLKKGSTGSFDSLVLRVRADNSGTPGTTDLATSTVNGSVLTTSFADVAFQLSSPLSLTANTTYWLIVDPGTNSIVNGDLNTYLYVQGSFSDVWSGGSVVIGVDNSTSWTSWSYDLNFSMEKCVRH